MEKRVETVSTRPGSLAELDRTVSLHLYNALGVRVPRAAFMLLEHTGNGLLWLSAVPLLWAWSHDPINRWYLANFFLCFWIDLVVVGTLKALLRRPRPLYNHAGDFLLVVAVDQYSFPSGHAARVSFITAFAFVCYAATRPLACFALSVWTVVTALSRALMGRHYIGDVGAGLLLGLVTVGIGTRGLYSPQGFWVTEATSAGLYTSTGTLWHRTIESLKPT